MQAYKLRYLPQYYEDMRQHTDYIANHLQNPQAAIDLIDATEEAILERQHNAEAFEQYHSRKDRRYRYYRIYVRNFSAFYVIIPEKDHKVMEVRRFLFGKSNWKHSI